MHLKTHDLGFTIESENTIINSKSNTRKKKQQKQINKTPNLYRVYLYLQWI